MTRRPLAKIVVAVLLSLVAVQGVQAATGYTQIIFRDDAFATQRTNYLCTAAVVQNIVNIATGSTRDGKPQQLEFYGYGLDNNRYDYRNRRRRSPGHGGDARAVHPGLGLGPGREAGQAGRAQGISASDARDRACPLCCSSAVEPTSGR